MYMYIIYCIYKSVYDFYEYRACNNIGSTTASVGIYTKILSHSIIVVYQELMNIIDKCSDYRISRVYTSYTKGALTWAALPEKCTYISI